MTETITPEPLIAKFDLRFDSKLFCTENATLNMARIVLQSSENQFPQIYFHYEVSHAYLAFQKTVFNGGVTASPGNFPDFSLKDLRQYANNSTFMYLWLSIYPFYKKIKTGEMLIDYQSNIDKFNYRANLHQAFSGQELSLIIPRFRMKYLELKEAGLDKF